MRTSAETNRSLFAQGKRQPARAWLGKKQPPEMVERRISKIRGDKHWLWKGGAERRQYRRNKTKTVCRRCFSRDNLSIHHKDFDHYNDSEDNLQVLCVSCHMSLHKQAWWDAKKKGEPLPVSNGPVGWERHSGYTRPGV